MINKIKDKIKQFKPYQEEFDKMNAKYNNVIATVLSFILIFTVVCIVIIGVTLHKKGNSDISEIMLILPIYIIMLVISTMTIICLKILRTKNLDSSNISEAVSVIQIVLCIILMLISGHIEISQTGIKNINATILVMFAIVFCLRFKLYVTLLIEIITTIAVIILLIIEKSTISNFLPSMVNIIVAGVLCSICSFLYWKSRIENYIMSNEFKKLANSDTLTKVFNRRGFDSFLAVAWDDCLKANTQIAILIIDIDYFKNYNDYYGHIKGDECLANIADVLSKSIRNEDFIARYGGEEFAIIMVDSNVLDVEEVTKRIFNNIKNCNIPHQNSLVSQRVTVSIGCMVGYPEYEGLTKLEFIALADEALYMAKDRGRNKLVFSPRIKNEC